MIKNKVEIAADLKVAKREIRKIESTGLFCREDKQIHYFWLKTWWRLTNKRKEKA